MTLAVLLVAAVAAVLTVLVLIYHFRRPDDEFSPLADGLRALQSVQTRPGLTP